MNVKNVAITTAIVGAMTVGATEWNVYSTEVGGATGCQQLTNAFAQAKSGDTITIHAGTYNLSTEELMFRYESNAAGDYIGHDGTCLESKVDNLTVRGDPSVARDEIILSGLGSNSVSQDGQHAIMRLTGNNCTVRHLTFYKGRSNTNAIVYRNGAQLNTDKWIYRRGGGLLMNKTSGTCEDCVFDTCYAGQGAGVYAVNTVRNCVFTNNNAVANNAGGAASDINFIYDSSFFSNSRAAIRACSGIVSNCLFVGNWHNGGAGLLQYQTGGLVDCTFSNNITVCVYLHGAKYMPNEITRCTFANNTSANSADSAYQASAGIGGPVVCSKPLTDCTFIGCNQISNFPQRISGCTFRRGTTSGSGSLIADCPNVVDCEFDGEWRELAGSTANFIAAIDKCNLTRCKVHDFSIHWGFLFHNVHAMTNCLVTAGNYWGGGSGHVFHYSDGQDANIVNCTIADITSANAMYNNDGESGTVTFRNSLFHNNKIGGQTQGKFDFYCADNSSYAVTNRISMEYTVYRCGNNSAKVDIPSIGIANKVGKSFNPLFLKDRLPDVVHENPYALYHKSPCIGIGDNGSWMAIDTDLAGNLRLNDVVDLGCYENWDNDPSTIVIFR